MRGSNLVIGANKDQIEDYIKSDLQTTKKDVHFVDLPEGKKSIGIDQIKEVISFLNTRPEKSATKKVFIKNGESMTTQAQNAFLKTLEEPPEYAQITIFTLREDDMLETLVSRCRKIHINAQSSASTSKYDEFIKSTLSAKFDWAEKTAKLESAEIVGILEDLITGARGEFRATHHKTIAENIKLLSATREDVDKLNVNKRLALENLVINLII